MGSVVGSCNKLFQDFSTVIGNCLARCCKKGSGSLNYIDPRDGMVS